MSLTVAHFGARFGARPEAAPTRSAGESPPPAAPLADLERFARKERGVRGEASRPPWKWTPAEAAVSVLHHAVFAAATNAAYSRLRARR